MVIIMFTSIKDIPLKNFLIGLAGFTAVGIGVLAMSKINDNDQQSEQNEQIKETKPAGIYNEGNTCFVNSLLQALASVKSFEQNLSQILQNGKAYQDSHELLLRQLHSVILKINTGSDSVDVIELLRLIETVKEGLINLEQQDTHELYTAIVASFEELVNKRKRLDLSISAKMVDPQEQVQNKLIGYTKSSIICLKCKNQTAIKIHPFYDLSLEIRSPYVIDIRTALKQFEREEIIENWTCTKCSILNHIKKIEKANKQLKGINALTLKVIGQQIINYLNILDTGEHDLQETNSILSQFVKRYSKQYDNMIGDIQRDKIFIAIDGIQTKISKRTLVTKYPKILVIHFKQLIINPFSGDLELLRKYLEYDQQMIIKTKNKQKKYKLTSLLTHMGNESMGHYFTFRRLNKDSQEWYCISDTSSKQCQWEFVKKNRAYMLFYQLE